VNSVSSQPHSYEVHGPIRIAATSTALPKFRVTQEEVKFHIGRVFSIAPKWLDAMMEVIKNSQIKQRYFIHPVDYIVSPRPLSQISREYQEHAVRLGKQAAADCLERAGMKAEEIDLLITVSCTGVMIPSVDAHLINEMRFREDVRRLPITELGCAGGAAAMSLARDFLRGNPEANVMVLSVELSSLTFQRDNLTQANLISTVLFGDGAAAAILTGREGEGPRIVDTSTYLFPNSLDAMGFDLKESGLNIVLSKDVPQMIREKIKGLVTTFLGRHSLCKERISAFVLHPGGQKLMLYMEEELGLKQEQTEFSWTVLREYGNLSSASVIFVLHEWLTKRNLGAGAYGLMAAFGPGFSAEMLLLQWP
jgi:alkylresorcinol/alkylpyrone synthase